MWDYLASQIQGGAIGFTLGFLACWIIRGKKAP